MTDHDLHARLRVFLQARAADGGAVPDDLWQDVWAIPDQLGSDARRSRGLVVMAAAALLLALVLGVAVGVGSGLIRLPNLSLPSWTLTGPMTTARTEGHTVTVLADGRVLVTGETSEIFTQGVWRSAEGSWRETASMHEPRSGHTATLLPDGRVLVAGGFPPDRDRNSDPGGLSAAEVFDPASGTWTAVPDMHEPRSHHTATLLLDGRVLVVGGTWSPGSGASSRPVELFDPATNTWEQGQAMLANRSEHTATLLLDGRVLVAGCEQPGDEGLPRAEIFDPIDGTWVAAEGMSARCLHSAVLLADGQVLLAGDGYDWTGSTEVFEPRTGAWTPSGQMIQPRVHFTTTRLSDGRVLVTGSGDGEFGAHPPGESDITVEIYDPRSGRWTSATPMLRDRGWHTSTLLNDGRVLVVGGFGGDAGLGDEAEIYDMGSGD